MHFSGFGEFGDVGDWGKLAVTHNASLTEPTAPSVCGVARVAFEMCR